MSYTAVIISVLALALKLVTIYRSRALVRSAPLQILIIAASLLILNLCELAGYKLAKFPATGYPILITYYVFLAVAIHSILALVIENTGLRRMYWLPPLLVVSLITQVAILIPNIGIAGIESIGYTATRIPGKYYFIIQIGLVIPAILIVGVSLISLSSKIQKQRQFAYIHLACFAPIAIALIGVALAMLEGAKINASAIISLAVCVPLWLLLHTSNSVNRYIVLTYLPFTTEQKRMRELCRRIAAPSSGMKEVLREVEMAMISAALEQANGNKAEAARILGVSRAKISRDVGDFNAKDQT